MRIIAARGVLVLYCLLIAYCCVWVPWRFDYYRYDHAAIVERAGYGWVWSGPPHDDTDRASPDFPLIGLRLLSATAITGAMFLLVSKKHPNY